MRALVIGGTGLIGTAVAARLMREGHEVAIFVRGRTPARLPAAPRWIHGDRRDHREFEAKIRAAGRFDCVIDMLAYSAADARSAIRAFRGGTTRYLLCSSVAVYGGSADRYPIVESEPLRPTGRYGQAKTECETVLREAHAAGDLPVTTLRLSQTYGEGGTIVHTFGWGANYLARIRKGRAIVVPGDGAALWSAAHVDDVAGAFVAAATSDAAIGKVYNIASDEWMTRDQYHRCVARALAAPPPRLVHIPSELLAIWAPTAALAAIEFFQYPGIFDVRAAERDLGFRCAVPFVEGVRRTVAHLDAHGCRSAGADEADALEDGIVAAWAAFVAAQASHERTRDAGLY